jgi:hypothetical protein
VFGTGFTLVKNWNFGADGTVKSIADMSREFLYHDQFGTTANGDNYGSVTASPDASNALGGQRSTRTSASSPTTRSRRSCCPTAAETPIRFARNVVNGSFMAKFAPARGGSRLGRDILWQTRVKYETPREFWFALWNAGNKWDRGAELDLVRELRLRQPAGRRRHQLSTAGTGTPIRSVAPAGSTTTNWESAMRSVGVTSFKRRAVPHLDAAVTARTTRTASTVDGVGANGQPDARGAVRERSTGRSAAARAASAIDFHFLFDAGWAHRKVDSVNDPVPMSELTGKFYEFDYSRSVPALTVGFATASRFLVPLGVNLLPRGLEPRRRRDFHTQGPARGRARREHRRPADRPGASSITSSTVTLVDRDALPAAATQPQGRPAGRAPARPARPRPRRRSRICCPAPPPT